MRNLVNRFDSVFSPVLEFAAKLPYADDEPYLDREEIESEMDRLEDDFAEDMARLVSTETRKLMERLEPAIDRGDFKAINEADWNLRVPLQRLLWSHIAKGWDLGQEHGFAEVEIALDEQGRQEQGFEGFASLWATFARGRFDNRKAPLRKHYMQEFLEGRTVWMSNKVDSETKARIKEEVTRATVGENGEKIGKRELYRRIGAILGEDQSDGPKTREERQRNRGIRARAKLIGRTELTAVYSMGRLEAYRRSGLVRRIRYLTFEWNPSTRDRPCRVCAPKNGTILYLDTDWELIVSRYAIPAHGNCRCVYVPIVDGDNALAADPGRKPSPIAGGPLDLKWLGATVGSAGQILVTNAIKAEVSQLMQEERQKKANRRMAISAAISTGTALSVGALLYIFLREARNRGYGELAADVISSDLTDAIKKKLPSEIKVRPASQVALTLRQQVMNPKLLAGLAEIPNPQAITPEQLRAMGVPEAEITKMRSLIDSYLKWLAERGQVTVGGVDLNLASVPALLATGVFTPKQAAAIVAYTKKKPLKTLDELNEVRYEPEKGKRKGRQAFTPASINRLRFYYLRPNMNDQRLSQEDIANSLGVTPRTARIIKAELDKGTFQDWDDFRNRTRLTRGTVDRLKNKARLDQVALPRLLQDERVREKVPVNLRQLNSMQQDQPASPLQIRPNQTMGQVRSQAQNRVEDLTARVGQYVDQVENRLPNRDKAQIDRAINRRYEVIDSFADQVDITRPQSDQIRSQARDLEQQLLSIEQQWSAGTNLNLLDRQAKALEKQLNALEKQTAKIDQTIQKQKTLADQQIAKVDSTKEKLRGLQESAANPSQERSVRSEIQGLLDALDRTGIEDPALRQRLNEAIETLSPDQSPRMQRLNNQQDELGQIRSRLNQSRLYHEGAKIMIRMVRQRLNELRRQGMEFSQQLKTIRFVLPPTQKLSRKYIDEL